MLRVSKGDYVFIVPIAEAGRVRNIRTDVRGEPLIDVTRDSDGVSHFCRDFELREVWRKDVC